MMDNSTFDYVALVDMMKRRVKVAAKRVAEYQDAIKDYDPADTYGLKLKADGLREAAIKHVSLNRIRYMVEAQSGDVIATIGSLNELSTSHTAESEDVAEAIRDVLAFHKDG